MVDLTIEGRKLGTHLCGRVRKKETDVPPRWYSCILYYPHDTSVSNCAVCGMRGWVREGVWGGSIAQRVVFYLQEALPCAKLSSRSTSSTRHLLHEGGNKATHLLDAPTPGLPSPSLKLWKRQWKTQNSVLLLVLSGHFGTDWGNSIPSSKVAY